MKARCRSSLTSSLSLCELIVGGKDGLQPVQKTIIDRCVRLVYQTYLNDPRPENMPILEDLYNLLRSQDFGADYKTKSGTKRCEFYNEGFRRNNNIAPEFVDIMPKYRGQIKPNSLAGRLKSGQCEMCGANPVKVYMHHVKRLKDLNADNEFDELMLLKRRKSLALCPKCYEEAKTKSLKL